MQIKIIGSTIPEEQIELNTALNFSGKMAGICYMPDDLETLLSEAEEKTNKRVQNTLKSGHHSVYDHVTLNLAFIDVPKILAMILNNEKMYTTSEKSGRYTKMGALGHQSVLYDKWIEIFKNEILKEYPNFTEKQVIKLAMENARTLLDIFTPSTTMAYTVSLRQLNYILYWMENFIKDAPDTDFNIRLKPVFAEFIDNLKQYRVEGLDTATKNRGFSLISEELPEKEEFGMAYCTNYTGTFTHLAQALRHRTLDYTMKFLPTKQYFVPYIIRGTDYEQQWLDDVSTIEFPQAMLVEINEIGSCQNFLLKCMERFCGAAQLEIAIQTKNTLEKYMEATKDTYPKVYEMLKPYSTGARCTFPWFKCTSPCVFGPKGAFTRKV